MTRLVLPALLLLAATACSGADSSDKDPTDTESATDTESTDTEDTEDTEVQDDDPSDTDDTEDTEVEVLVLINEVLAGNESINQDEQGDNDDWLELYNAGSATVDLSGWSLTDKADEELELFALPEGTELGAGEYLVIWCDDDGGDTSETQIHLDFKLSGDGETVRLFDADEALVDTLTYPELEDDVGYGRLPDGSDALGETEPTPGESNQSLE